MARIISSKAQIGRSPGAAFKSGTISLSKISAKGSGRRRPRSRSHIEGSTGACRSRYPVAVLKPALAATAVTEFVCRNFMNSLIW